MEVIILLCVIKISVVHYSENKGLMIEEFINKSTVCLLTCEIIHSDY